MATVNGRKAKEARRLARALGASSPPVSRNNHFVPHLYLGAWADERDLVQVIDVRREKHYPKNISHVMFERDFYTVTLDDGTESDVWERLLARVEGLSAEPLRRAREGDWPLDDDARHTLADFIAIQFGRGPDMRKMVNNAMTAVASQMTKLYAQHPESLRGTLEQDLGRAATDEELADFACGVGKGEFTVELHNNRHLELFPVTEDIAPIIYAMDWSLLTAAPDARQFVTGDRPIALKRPPEYPDFCGVGLTTAQYVTFPLSPRRCLRMEFAKDGDEITRTRPLDTMREASFLEVNVLNNLTIAYAMDHVITTLPRRREHVRG